MKRFRIFETLSINPLIFAPKTRLKSDPGRMDCLHFEGFVKDIFSECLNIIPKPFWLVTTVMISGIEPL